MNNFYELPSERQMYEYQYDVVAGTWLEKYDEAILVLSDSGSISDITLYAMGLRDRTELRSMIESFMNNANTELNINTKGETVSFETLMSFKVISPADRY